MKVIGELGLFLGILVLLSPLLSVRLNLVGMKSYASYPIHNLNTGINYTTIQEGINANETQDFQTILVDDGTYFENVVMNKSLEIVGENRETTIIDGNGSGPALTITANNVSVNSLTLMSGNSSPFFYTDPAINVLSKYNEISGNILKQSPEGIYLNQTDNTVDNNIIINNGDGVCLSSSLDNRISNNEITSNSWNGILAVSSDSNEIIGNTVINNGVEGIEVTNSSYNNLKDNFLSTDGLDGIFLQGSMNNTLSGNTVTLCTSGLLMKESGANTLQSNNLTLNEYNFGIYQDGDVLLDLMNSVDTSNTVDGNPIYYLANQHDQTIPNNAGYVALVNCTRITVDELNLTKNWQGLLIAFTNDSTVRNVNASLNEIGFSIRFSTNITVSANSISNNQVGIRLWNTNQNLIRQNSLDSNYDGIEFDYSDDNTLEENTVLNTTGYTVLVILSNDNLVFHNNFILNLQQLYGVYCYNSSDFWDNGFEGNYWNQTNVDLNHDGIADSPYIIDANNIDHYPLMGTCTNYVVNYFTPPLVSHACNVMVISNSTISDFVAPIWIEHPEVIFLMFNASGAKGSTGFCRVSFPTAIMNGTYHVFLNDTEIPYTLLPCSDANYSYLYFNYTHSTKEVIIIPEFPSVLILPLFMIATLLTVIVFKRKREKRSSTCAF